MRQALTVRYDGEGITTFLSKAEKVYNQAEVGDRAKFELPRDALKSNQMLSSLRCSKDPRVMKA